MTTDNGLTAEVQPGPQSANGYGHGRPSASDIFVTAGRGRSDMVEQMLKGSEKASELMARTDVSEEEIGLIVTTLGQWSAFMEGGVNIPQQVWYYLTLKISKNRKSRDEAIKMMAANALRMRRNMMGRMFGRGGGTSRDIDRGEVMDDGV